MLKYVSYFALVECLSIFLQYPTRKIYMLFNLEPSSTITGGPWYTDSELDTEFINLLASACLKFIQEKVGYNTLLRMMCQKLIDLNRPSPKAS